MGKKDSFSPSNRSFAGQTNCFITANSSWSWQGESQRGRPAAAASTASKPLSTLERVARFTGLTFLAMVGLFGAWLLTAWLLHGLVHSFDPVPLSGVFASAQPRSTGIRAMPAATPAPKASDSRLLRAVQADLNDGWREAHYERVVLPELGNQGACVVWHEEIGQLGMALRVASPAEKGGIPLNSPDLLHDMRGQLD